MDNQGSELSPQNIPNIEVKGMELEDINPSFIPPMEDAKPHYIQNHSATINASTRAAKYRDGRAKLSKYITVPEPNQTHGTARNSTYQKAKSSRPSTLHGSIHRVPDVGHGGTVRSHGGTVRSHGGTIRSHNGFDGFSQHNGGVGIVPQYGGRHLEGTLKGLPQNGMSLSRHHGSVAFRRTIEYKDNMISNFTIELDQHERHRFSPGEEISGKIIFDIRGKLEIRFIEFLIIGQTAVSIARRTPQGGYKTWRDIFLNKRSYVVGSADGKWTSIVTPGHFVSNFRFCLPQGIPSTLRYKDEENGLGVDISYLLKARICDDIGAASARSNHSINRYVKVLLSRRFPFLVKRPFDIHSIPMALSSVTHSEDVSLSSCSIFSAEMATIYLCLDRSCFLAGDDIKIRLEVHNAKSKKIKKIRGELIQGITLVKPKTHFTNTVATAEDKRPKGVTNKKTRQRVESYDIVMPTHLNILPNINPGCRLIKASYSLRVSVDFSSCGGTLALDVPINIGPCTDPINLEKRNSVPVFNKPIRFPHFSPHANGDIVSNGDIQQVRKSKSANVHTKYSHGSSMFCCCADDTMI